MSIDKAPMEFDPNQDVPALESDRASDGGFVVAEESKEGQEKSRPDTAKEDIAATRAAIEVTLGGKTDIFSHSDLNDPLKMEEHAQEVNARLVADGYPEGEGGEEAFPEIMARFEMTEPYKEFIKWTKGEGEKDVQSFKDLSSVDQEKSIELSGNFSEMLSLAHEGNKSARVAALSDAFAYTGTKEDSPYRNGVLLSEESAQNLTVEQGREDVSVAEEEDDQKGLMSRFFGWMGDKTHARGAAAVLAVVAGTSIFAASKDAEAHDPNFYVNQARIAQERALARQQAAAQQQALANQQRVQQWQWNRQMREQAQRDYEHRQDRAFQRQRMAQAKYGIASLGGMTVGESVYTAAQDAIVQRYIATYGEEGLRDPQVQYMMRQELTRAGMKANMVGNITANILGALMGR